MSGVAPCWGAPFEGARGEALASCIGKAPTLPSLIGMVNASRLNFFSFLVSDFRLSVPAGPKGN